MVPLGQMVNVVFYIDAIKFLFALIRCVCPEYRAKEKWRLLYDNAQLINQR